LREPNLTGLPTAVVLVAEFDPLRDEGLAYADRLVQSGVKVERFMANGQIHGFLRRLDLFDRATSMTDELAGSIARIMAGASSMHR
jgi:acetyl esterase